MVKKMQPGSLKIIAGEARGRSILAPAGRTTRPILGVLKERLFNILGQRLDGQVVWDLFAGSGSLGLEALSRGAVSCVFLEKDRAAMDCLEQNIATLRMGDRATAVRSDVFRWVEDESRQTPDVIFCDTPYPLYKSHPEAMAALFRVLSAQHLLDESLLVVRTPSDHEWVEVPGLTLNDRRVHGENALLLLSV